MAEHDEHDERDSGTSQTGRVKAPVADPPTLPPFDGPRPATIHGFPKVDVFGDGVGVNDLFDVPKLGSKSPSGAAKVAAPPPVAPLPGRKAPPTGPLPIIPPIGAAAPTPSVPEIGAPEQIADEKPSGTLPPANSLIAKIRAAKHKAGGPEPSAAGLPPIKPSAKTKKTEADEAKAEEPELPAQEAEAEEVEAEEVEAEEAEATEVPAAPKPTPIPAAPKTEAASGDAVPSVIPSPSSPKAWLEPVPLKTLDRRPEPADADTSAAPPPPPEPGKAPAASTSSPSLRRPPDMPSASASSPSLRRVPEPPTDGEDEQTIVAHKVPGAVSAPPPPTTSAAPQAPPPPSTGPMAPPPPPTSVGAEDDEHQPKIGVPYVPPAVVLKADETLDDEIAEELANEAAAPELPRPARLPSPGTRLPPADPIVAARLAQAAAEQLTSVPAAVPQQVTQQDTAALVAGLADELIGEVEREQAVTLKAKVPEVAKLRPKPDDRRRKYALAFLGAAALLSIIALSLPDGNKGEDASLVPDIEAPEQPAEPDPTLLAEAEPEPEPEPPPPPVEVPAEAEPEAGTETGGAAEPEPEPEPEPEVADPEADKPAPGPKRKRTKSNDGSKSESKSEPNSDPKPKSTSGSTDNRSADDLYKAAQSAYRSGRAADAYKLAYESWKKNSKSKTAELMTLAACKLRDTGKARSSLSKVTAIKRNSIKKECKAMGVSL